VFSPDSGMVAAKVEKGGKYFVAVNGSVWSKPFDALWSPVFSPDGKKLLVRAREGDKFYRKVIPVSTIAV